MDFMKIVREICNAESTDCRSLNKSALARKLMDMVSIPKNAEITEIPLDYDDQVSILFKLPNDNKYYSLYAGHWLDDTERMWVAIIGRYYKDGDKLRFLFYTNEKEIEFM